MGSAVDNSQRARELVDSVRNSTWCGCRECHGSAVERIERELNLAEDRGGERAAQLPSTDPLTIEALRGMVRELLVSRVGGGAATEAAANICQVIIANFHVRLMDEVTAEMERTARKCQDCGLGESVCSCHDESETGHDSSESR